MQISQSHSGVDPSLVQRAREKLEIGYKRLIGFETSTKGFEWFGTTVFVSFFLVSFVGTVQYSTHSHSTVLWYSAVQSRVGAVCLGLTAVALLSVLSVCCWLGFVRSRCVSPSPSLPPLSSFCV